MGISLENSRKAAAEASAGISSQPIYATAMNAILSSDCHGEVLDFGAGTGGFAELLLKSDRFDKVHAVDLVDYGGTSDDRIHWLFADLNSALPLASQSLDAIASIEVIEHLENPRFLAREWFRLLKPKGRLVVSTPNNESWRSLLSLLVRGHFAAFTGSSYPAHITALLRLDLIRVLSEAGFKDISFTYSNHGGIPGRPTTTWQKVSMGLLKGRRFSDNLICTAIKDE